MNQFQSLSNNPYYPRNTMLTGPQINWVQGIEGAKAYQLSPNSNIQLMDSENDGIFYIKTSDNIGMCNLRIFKYEEITEQKSTPQPNLSEYVRKDELESLINSMLGGTNESTVSTAKSSKNTITK